MGNSPRRDFCAARERQRDWWEMIELLLEDGDGDGDNRHDLNVFRRYFS